MPGPPRRRRGTASRASPCSSGRGSTWHSRSPRNARAAPNRLHYPGPGVSYADVPGGAAPGVHGLGFLVQYDGIDPQGGRGAATAGFHGLQGREGTAKETPRFGHPPRVDDGRLALAHDLVVPPPYLGLDRFAHGDHELEVVAVLGRLVMAEFAQHPDRGRCRVEDVDAEALGYPPGPARVWVGGSAL